MSVYNLLSEYGQFSAQDSFNGYLSDYIDEYGDCQEFFKKLAQLDDNICVFKNFALKINQQLLSNKKIGYRDIVKVPEGVYKIPYIIYFKNEDVDRAVIINSDNYIEARGMYYCLSEPESEFEQDRCEVLAYYLTSDNQDELVEVVKELMKKDTSVGYLQRKYDNQYISDIEEMKDDAVNLAKELFDYTLANVDNLEKKEKADLIYQTVVRAFLIKKSLYVKYMTNKRLLNDRHSSNAVEQRKFAKAYIDEVTIVPYFKLWNQNAEEENEKVVD